MVTICSINHLCNKVVAKATHQVLQTARAKERPPVTPVSAQVTMPAGLWQCSTRYGWKWNDALHTVYARDATTLGEPFGPDPFLAPPVVLPVGPWQLHVGTPPPGGGGTVQLVSRLFLWLRGDRCSSGGLSNLAALLSCDCQSTLSISSGRSFCYFLGHWFRDSVFASLLEPQSDPKLWIFGVAEMPEV